MADIIAPASQFDSINKISAIIVSEASLSNLISAQSNKISVLSDRFSTLRGGAAGFVLKKNTAADFDWSWLATGGGGTSATVTSQEVSTLSNAISVISQGLSVVSNALSNEISNRTSADNALSNAVSIVSNALSNEISNRTSAVNVVSNAVSILSQQVSVLSQNVSVLSQGLSVVSNAASNALSVANAASNAASVVSNALSNEISNRTSAVNVVSQAVSVLSQQVSVLSQQVSVLSQQVSVLSQAVSVLSQAFSVMSAGVGLAQRRVLANLTTVSAIAFTNVSGMSISVVATAFYEIKGRLVFTVSTPNTVAFGLTYPALCDGNLYMSSLLSIAAGGFPGSLTSAQIAIGNIQSLGMSTVATAQISALYPSSAVQYSLDIEGVVHTSTNAGTIQLQVKNSAAATSITFNPGSYMQAFRIL